MARKVLGLLNTQMSVSPEFEKAMSEEIGIDMALATLDDDA